MVRFAEFSQSEDVFSEMKVAVKVVPDSDDSRSVQTSAVQNRYFPSRIKIEIVFL